MAETIIQSILNGLAPRAPAMIVTIYGDVVVPRGGVLWMGTLIEVGAALGLSETLIRTAVSRLVAAGQLEGERDGRRSYYRLAGAMRQEFSAAARLLYGPARPVADWMIHQLADPPEDLLREAALARIGPDLYIRPAHPGIALPGLAFRATPEQGAAALPGWASALWPLEALAGEYRAMIGHFAPLDAALAAGAALSPEAALVARLLLVHGHRATLLRDPRLPRAALPADWPGETACALFRRLYLALSGPADSHIGARFEGGAGPLPAHTAGTQARLLALAEG